MKGWRSLKRCFLVDAAGLTHFLEDPAFTKKLTRFQKITGAELPVRWHLRTGDTLELSCIQELVREDFQSYEPYWEDFDRVDLERQIIEASTISEILKLF